MPAFVNYKPLSGHNWIPLEKAAANAPLGQTYRQID